MNEPPDKVISVRRAKRHGDMHACVPTLGARSSWAAARCLRRRRQRQQPVGTCACGARVKRRAFGPAREGIETMISEGDEHSLGSVRFSSVQSSLVSHTTGG